MSAFFATPADYLNYLQSKYTARYTSDAAADDQFAQITARQIQEAGLQIPSGPVAGISTVIVEAFSSILASLDETARTNIQNNIAAGVVERGPPSAFIARSPDGKFAILFGSGLAIFFHKFFKLIAAYSDPSVITYCNRKPAGDLSREDVKLYLDEFLENYRKTGIPRGPLLKLTPAASAKEAAQLAMAETFILCHEIGHFLNGDLSDSKSYSALPDGIEGEEFVENVSYEKEHKADVAGFRIFAKVFEKEIPAENLQAALIPLVAMFDAMFILGGGISPTHPHPYDRAVRIAREHFGAELGEKLRRALTIPAELPFLFSDLKSR